MTSNNQLIPLLILSTRVMTEDSAGPLDGDSSQGSLEMGDRVGYDPTTETYRVQHDWTSNGSPSMTVVDAIAAVTGTEPEEMEPLHSVVDSDALDAILSSGKEADLQAEFGYMERSVTVTANGEVIIR